MKSLLASACLVLATFLPLLASADEPKPPASAPRKGDELDWKVKQRREVLFKEGVKLIEQEKWKEALDKLREVQRLHPHPRVLLWMAYAIEQQGHLLKAKAIYRQALSEGREGKLDDVERDAAKKLAEITVKIPRIVVRTGAATGASLVVDAVGVDFGTAPVEVEPGKHVLVVTAPGRQSFNTQIVVGLGEEQVVDAPLPTSAVEPLPQALPQVRRPVPLEAILVSVAGGGLAIGGGVVLGLGLDNGATNLQKGGAALLGIGGAALVGGLVWTIISATRAPDGTTATPPPIWQGPSQAARGSGRRWRSELEQLVEKEAASRPAP